MQKFKLHVTKETRKKKKKKLGAFAKLRTVTTSFVAWRSALMEQLGSHCVDFHEILYSDTWANEDNSLAETWFPVGFYRKSFNSFWMLPTI